MSRTMLMLPALLAVLLAAASSGVESKVIRVGGVPRAPGVGGWVLGVQWTWRRPKIQIGDKLLFQYKTFGKFIHHTVWAMADEKHYKSCNFTGAIKLGSNKYMTGPLTKGSFYYACNVAKGYHCKAGQKISVTLK